MAWSRESDCKPMGHGDSQIPSPCPASSISHYLEMDRRWCMKMNYTSAAAHRGTSYNDFPSTGVWGSDRWLSARYRPLILHVLWHAHMYSVTPQRIPLVGDRWKEIALLMRKMIEQHESVPAERTKYIIAWWRHTANVQSINYIWLNSADSTVRLAMRWTARTPCTHSWRTWKTVVLGEKARHHEFGAIWLGGAHCFVRTVGLSDEVWMRHLTLGPNHYHGGKIHVTVILHLTTYCYTLILTRTFVSLSDKVWDAGVWGGARER